MSAAELQDASRPSAHGLSREEARVAARALNRRRLIAFALVAPLLAFVIFAFFAPVATMLHRSVHNPTVVELILGLTPSECEVAVLLAEGNSVRDIARTTGRRESTVRWHVKHIFNKHGINRQVELVQLVLSLAATPAPGR